MRDTTYSLHFFHRRMRSGKPDILGNGPVEHEIVLQNDAELGSEVAQADAGQVVTIDQHTPR